MDRRQFQFMPGEFVRWQIPNGSAFGRILSVNDASVSVSRWAVDDGAATMADYFIPPVISDQRTVDVIPLPALSSLIFVHHVDDYSSFKTKYVFGMQDVYCTREPVLLWFPPQSLSAIIFDGISWLLSELHRVLSNRRQSQDMFSSFSISTSVLLWEYLKEKFHIPVVLKEKTYTFCVSNGRDLSVTKVKARYTCQILRVETPFAIQKLISIFGLSSVAGVRKPWPLLSKKLRSGEPFVSTRGGVFLLDVVNLVDVQDNVFPAPRSRFTYNGYGRKGIDFIYTPELKMIKITVRYKKYIVQDAIDILRELGFIPRNEEGGQQLSDDELERMLRG